MIRPADLTLQQREDLDDALCEMGRIIRQYGDQDADLEEVARVYADQVDYLSVLLQLRIPPKSEVGQGREDARKGA